MPAPLAFKVLEFLEFEGEKKTETETHQTRPCSSAKGWRPISFEIWLVRVKCRKEPALHRGVHMAAYTQVKSQVKKRPRQVLLRSASVLCLIAGWLASLAAGSPPGRGIDDQMSGLGAAV